MCRHWWICGEITSEGNVMEHRVMDFAVGSRPLAERLGVW